MYYIAHADTARSTVVVYEAADLDGAFFKMITEVAPHHASLSSGEIYASDLVYPRTVTRDLDNSDFWFVVAASVFTSRSDDDFFAGTDRAEVEAFARGFLGEGV